MDQKQAPILEALAAIEARPLIGFGAPAHHRGTAMPTGTRGLLGKRVFQADVLTPKGLDDRTESLHAVQRAHEIAAEAWNADFCRFVTGGSTQSLHIVLAAVAGPGDTVLFAANAHKAERAHALATGLNVEIVPVEIDETWDIEHGVRPEALAQALADHPEARALLLVSPTYFGVTSNIAELADLCHDHGIPLICDAAWGGAFAFSDRLPADPLTKGADVAIYSLHKTMGALGQGSAILAKTGVLDVQRLSMAFELFETTSPSVPILASLDATRRDHALSGENLWSSVLDITADLRGRLSAIKGLRVFGLDAVPSGAELDESKVLVDVSALGVSGYAVDDWLAAHHRVSVGLSDARNLLMVISLGTRRADIRALVRGLQDLVRQLDAGLSGLPQCPAVPGIGTLQTQMAMIPRMAFEGPAEAVRMEDAAGRIAAEIIAPAPPGVPRLVSGQQISDAHVAWLVAHRDAGAFFLDPVDPSERTIRVVA